MPDALSIQLSIMRDPAICMVVCAAVPILSERLVHVLRVLRLLQDSEDRGCACEDQIDDIYPH